MRNLIPKNEKNFLKIGKDIPFYNNHPSSNILIIGKIFQIVSFGTEIAYSINGVTCYSPYGRYLNISPPLMGGD